MLLERWKRKQLPTLHMLESNFANFIEEDGELSFSVLSRTVINDTCKASFDHLNKAYQGQTLLSKASHELIDDFGVFSGTSKHPTVSVSSAEVKGLADFFKTSLQQLQLNQFQTYPTLTTSHYEPKAKMDLITAQLASSTPHLQLTPHKIQLDQIIHTAVQVLEDVSRLLSKPDSTGITTELELFPRSPILYTSFSYSDEDTNATQTETSEAVVQLMNSENSPVDSSTSSISSSPSTNNGSDSEGEQKSLV